jgi:ubiquinone/menaquinone biosynthesis C-methylase UbiE
MKDAPFEEKPALKQKEPGGRQRSLGPVPDLEEYVAPDWWRSLFNSLYLKTDADVVDDVKITGKEVDMFSQILGISQDDRILDLCCGQGRHSLELTRRGFANVEGMDRSHYLIQRAKSQARKESLSIRFREGDARKLPYPPDTFDAVMILGNSFGYFETPQDDLRVLKEVARVLKPWGKLLVDIADGEFLKDNFQPRSWEWIDPKHFVCRERSLSLDKQRLISREVVAHTEKGVIVDQFYAERLYTKESITDLLAKAGFSEITVHAQISPDSKRNQDLGMMQRRIIVSAQIRKEWTPARKKPKELLNAVAEIRQKFGYEAPILVEEFLTGADLSMGIVGNPPESYQVLPIIEEDYSNLPEGLPRICGYEAKWLPSSPYWKNLRSIPARLPDETKKLLIEWCARLFERLECRDYARFDWRLDSSGLPKLLEVNPNPGWCWDGHLAKMAKIGGMSYAEMLAAILKTAEQRLHPIGTWALLAGRRAKLREFG